MLSDPRENPSSSQWGFSWFREACTSVALAVFGLYWQAFLSTAGKLRLFRWFLKRFSWSVSWERQGHES